MNTALQQQLIQNLRKIVRGLASVRNVFTVSHHYPTPLHTLSVHVPSSYRYPATPVTPKHYCIRSPEPTAAT